MPPTEGRGSRRGPLLDWATAQTPRGNSNARQHAARHGVPLDRLDDLKAPGYLAVFLAAPAAACMRDRIWAVDGGVNLKSPQLLLKGAKSVVTSPEKVHCPPPLEKENCVGFSPKPVLSKR